MKEIIAERAKKIPPFPSAGSFFKNYKLPDDYKDSALIKKFPELAKKIRSGKIATGYLIEQRGLKGVKVGGAMIANEHTNFIVNAGGATAQDVLALAEMCRKKVKEKYGLHLEIEKRLIGFD
jgi:UDP-N-acetylmuramate dehydrogenase